MSKNDRGQDEQILFYILISFVCSLLIEKENFDKKKIVSHKNC